MGPPDSSAPDESAVDIPFDQVGSAPEDAEPDPRYLDLRGKGTLPRTYMPPSMSGEQPRWIRVVAVGVIGIFLLATAVGVCLTYGPPLF